MRKMRIDKHGAKSLATKDYGHRKIFLVNERVHFTDLIHLSVTSYKIF